MARMPKDKIPPISVYLGKNERERVMAFIKSYACFTPSSFGRQSFFVNMELIEKKGLDPRTLRPKGV